MTMLASYQCVRPWRLRSCRSGLFVQIQFIGDCGAVGYACADDGEWICGWDGAVCGSSGEGGWKYRDRGNGRCGRSDGGVLMPSVGM